MRRHRVTACNVCRRRQMRDLTRLRMLMSSSASFDLQLPQTPQAAVALRVHYHRPKSTLRSSGFARSHTKQRQHVVASAPALIVRHSGNSKRCQKTLGAIHCSAIWSRYIDSDGCRMDEVASLSYAEPHTPNP